MEPRQHTSEANQQPVIAFLGDSRIHGELLAWLRIMAKVFHVDLRPDSVAP